MNSLPNARYDVAIPDPWQDDEPSVRVDYRLLMEGHSDIQEEWRERGEVSDRIKGMSQGLFDAEGYKRLLEEYPDYADMILDEVPEYMHHELEFDCI